MSATELRQSFRRRFRAVARQIWSLHVGRGIALTVVVASALVATVATVDYFLELPWAARAALLAVGVGIVAVLASMWVVRPALAWNRVRVASELEGLFPRLGQRLRTATQHGERSPEELAQEGVAPGLVAALEEETAEKVKPLPFQAALPMKPALLVGAIAFVCVAGLVAAAVLLPEWRTAVTRVALAPTPYTTLSATASAEAVNEGADVEILATISGRARPNLVLHVRDVGETEWRQETMEQTDEGFTARLPNLRTTTEFFVTAGPERTPVEQIVVRHDLKIVGTSAEVTFPAYTGLPPLNNHSGNFEAVQGSTAKFRFELDRAPLAAALIIKNPTKPKEPANRVEMAVNGRFVTAEMPLLNHMEYSVEARDGDNMPLAKNTHYVRVTADAPPRIMFESPGESMEVHTLAEVLMRVRASDDFGLTKLGIVFQVNNEEERTLVLEDITQPNQREWKAEQMLLLEQFLLTQKDCVAYYAFAEDGRPDGPQRTTTDLRFIDIRPFLRTYRLLDAPDEMPGGRQREFIFLDEVIARQRFNLNQTMRLEAHAKVRIDLAQVEKVAAFENKLATQTHELADFLIERAIDGGIILEQAEQAMLSAVDSLNGAKFATALVQQRDALRFLMEARNTIQQAIVKQTPRVRAQARQFDRIQRQKLRRPKQEAETLAQIADELAKLADDEDEVARALAAMANMQGGTGGNATDPNTNPMPGNPDPKTDPKNGGMEPKPEPKNGGTDPKVEPKNGKGGMMEGVRDKQDDIAGRAAGLEKIAATAKGLTGLAKARIGEAAKAANDAADALGQGDRPTARKEADKARETFRNAAKQVAALAAEEAAQQLAAARDLANDIAMQTAPPADPMMKNPGSGNNGDGKMPGLGNAAEQAKSLKDVLENLAGSTAEGDADAARKAGGILKQEDLKAAIERLEKAGVGDDKGERQDLADRFAALGQKLDQAYRETVAPRLEEIARLEREANDLEQRAGGADDPADWRRLRQQGAEFIERLEAAGLGNLVGEDLRSTLKTGAVANRETFNRGVAAVHTRLVAKLQEFVAGDRFASGNEAVPPEYKDLVERYLRALSAGGSK